MAFQTLHLRIAVVAVVFACAAGAAVSQEEPYRSKIAPVKPQVTSTLEATAPTAEETREAKALSTAVFAKPAAAARAADKVDAEKGVEIKTPF